MHTPDSENVPASDNIPSSPDRRAFLLKAAGWSQAAIAAALFGAGTTLPNTAEARRGGGVWVNSRGGGWNRRGGTGVWVNGGGGGGWVNRAGSWVNRGGGWINGRGGWINGGGGWVNRRGGGGGWVNRW